MRRLTGALCLCWALSCGPLATRSLAAEQSRGAVPARAPTRGPLSTGSGAAASSGEEASDGEGDAPQDQADPLVSNGLASPSCQAASAADLSAGDRHHCESSGFIATAAPTGNYGIDVHIDTGVLGVSSNWLSSAVQDILIAPAWMGLVWAVHALVVMLEWCFTIDLLPSAAAGGLGRGLRQTEATFTQPWLPLALSVASMIALYHGLIRRRVAQTLGEVVLMVAMMAGGLWVISDPSGTVGALGAWANQAALGTLAVAAQGAPTQPERVFGTSLDTIFSSAVEGPWCYLEFGDVAWCREPGRLDPRLRSAALKIAAAELTHIGCGSSSSSCVSPSSPSARTLEHSAQMLRSAQNNGAIFLALPPNGPARNSINSQDSLLRTMCQSANATSCRGADAAQAQFRTQSQTWARLCGLALIAAGTLGMLLLLGFLGTRLLAAALFGLLYLLLAPAMVLAPAFGEGGRALFRKWGMQLLGTVVTKLLFSFLLGVVLSLAGLIENLTALGWWTQWLLMSALWWGAFMRRHQALGVTAGALGHNYVERRSISRRIGSVIEARRRRAVDRWIEARKKPAPDVGLPTDSQSTRSPTRPGDKTTIPRPRTRKGLEQVTRGRDGQTPVHGESSAGQAADKRAQLERVSRARAQAEQTGNTRRAAELDVRARRIEAEAASDGLTPMEGSAPRYGGAHDVTPETSPHGRPPRARGPALRVGEGTRAGSKHVARIDYAALATLAGLTRWEYERLSSRRQREARVEIDRELAERRGPSSSHGRDRQGGEPGRAGGTPPGADRSRKGSQRTPIPRSDVPESWVMRDAREVEAGRKRQLGYDRP
ncbi:MAG TPA: hypothetical protein VGN25_02330 [Solirubrobacteraceae bacterium]|nr:hypothetical protein [Solirubrobacteraceae bacterium]